MQVGETIAVLASGPGLTQAVADQVKAAGLRAIAVNSSFRRAPWAWMLYAADFEWWMHPDNGDAQAFSGIKASCTPVPVPGLKLYKNLGCVGYSDEPDAVHTLGNSGAQALQIAIKTGAKRVLLCGFDMHDKSGCHWHGRHPAGLRDTGEHLYQKFRQRFAEVAPAMLARARIINVTPGSALTCFPQMTLECALEELEHGACIASS